MMTRGEGVKKSENVADVINGWPLTRSGAPYSSRCQSVTLMFLSDVALEWEQTSRKIAKDCKPPPS